MGDLDSLTTLVTDGSQGIDLASAQALTSDGAQVAICAREEARLQEATQQFE